MGNAPAPLGPRNFPLAEEVKQKQNKPIYAPAVPGHGHVNMGHNSPQTFPKERTQGQRVPVTILVSGQFGPPPPGSPRGAVREG